MPIRTYVLIVTLIVIGTLASFYSGFFLKEIVSKGQTIKKDVFPSQMFKPLFVDEVVLISKNAPHYVLKLSSLRQLQDEKIDNFNLKAFFYDGKEWERDYTLGKTPELYSIPKSDFIPKWEINYDPSYMLKQSASGEAKINNNDIEFDIPVFYNEMSVRSSPKYTKFMSETDGTMTINGTKYDSFVLYSRTYSFDAPESLVYTTDLSGIETEWLAFWDSEGNFISIDETIIDNKRTLDSYKAHSLAIEKDKSGKIQKSFELVLTHTGLYKYIIDIKENIGKKVTVTKINSVNDVADENSSWSFGQVEGEIINSNGKVTKGFGIYEQISQNVGR